MGERFFVESQIETDAPVAEERGQPFLETAAADVLPGMVVDGENRAVAASQAGVDELMLDGVRPQVHQFSMCRLGQQEIMQELGTVPGRNRLDGFELEDRSIGAQQIQEIGLAEAIEGNFDRHFGPRVPATNERSLAGRSSHGKGVRGLGVPQTPAPSPRRRCRRTPAGSGDGSCKKG